MDHSQSKNTPRTQSHIENTTSDERAAVLLHQNTQWYKTSHLLKLNSRILLVLLLSSANGYDGSLMNGLQALPEWYDAMGHPHGAWLGWFNAIYWLAAAITYPIAAAVAQKWGRKRGLYCGYVALTIGIALGTATPNDVCFLMSRLCIGIGAAMFGINAPLLTNEVAHPSQRGLINALYMCGWYVGSMIAAWVVYGTRTYGNSWTWRLPVLLQCLLPAISFFGAVTIPESPRWLISKGRGEEARQMLVKHHAGGDQSSLLVSYEYEEIFTAITAEAEASSSSSYLSMFKTPGNRHRLFISVTLGLFVNWVGNGVISYYLVLVLETVGITSVRDQTLISACMQIWNLLWSVGAAFCVDRVGRRPLFLSSAAVMLISYVLVTALSGAFAQSKKAAIGVAAIPFLFTFFAGYGLALTPFLTAYPCEIWPFALRARGLTVTWVSTSVAVFFNVFVNPIALDAIAWKYYIVFIAVLVAYGFTVYFYYPETKGRTLEAIAEVFDGQQASIDAEIARVTSRNSTDGKKE